MGLVTAQFNALEAVMRAVLCRLIGAVDAKRALVAINRLSFRLVVDAIGDLEKDWPLGEEQERLRDLVNNARQINETRNTLIHASWTQKKGELAMRFTIGKVGLHPVPVELEDFADDIAETMTIAMNCLGTPRTEDEHKK